MSRITGNEARSLMEAYVEVHSPQKTVGDQLSEGDNLITDDLLEEVLEEIISECLEFGYELEEVVNVVEEATLEYFDEAKITYGSDTESPEQRTARAKERLGGMKSAARKSAVKGAVDRVKATAQGVKASAGIAGSIAKDEARRAARAVSVTANKKKEEVKKGIKSLLGKGLRAAAGAAGKVAQTARKAGTAAGRAAEKLGEAKDNSYLETNMKKREKNNNDAINSMKKTDAHKSMAATAAKKLEEGVEIYDLVVEYLCTEGYAEDFEDAESIMVYLEPEAVEAIVESGWHRRNPEKIGTSADPDVRMNRSSSISRNSVATKSPERTSKEKKSDRRILYNYYGQVGKDEAIKRAKAARDAARKKRRNG